MPRRALLACCLVLLSCGTGASAAGGDEALPNQHAGPFRLLRAAEMTGRAPLLIDRNAPWEGPSAVEADDDPATGAALIFASWNTSIYRFETPEGRSVKSSGERVLEASEPWETSGPGHPSALRQGGELWLYYEAGGCVGRAVSTDNGKTFAKNPATPVLCGQAGWEGGALGAPAVYRGHDQKFHMIYQAGGALGEAVSGDGVAFERASPGPVLGARPAGPLAAGAKADDVFDSAAVGEAFGFTSTSPLGRPLTLVYYTGTDRLGRTAVGLAAREGDSGALQSNPAPVLTRHDARGPSALRRGETTLLYAAGRSSEVAAKWESVIIGAVAPADQSLPPPAAAP